MDVAEEVTDLLHALIAAVGGPDWAAVILLMVLFIVLVGGIFLIYRKMQASDKHTEEMFSLMSTLATSDRAPKEKDGK